MKSTNDSNKTYDYLPGTDIHLYQRKDMFRINTDTHLLGNFMKVKKGETVIDMGTNNGALLLYASQYDPGKLTGIDINEEACILACENLTMNEVFNAEIIISDVKTVVTNKVDVVVCNPPYFQNEKSRNNDNPFLDTARHEKYLTLTQMCQCASRFLKDRGRFYLVHRADRINEILIELENVQLKPKTLTFVYDANKEDAITVLVESIKGGSNKVKVTAPITINR